MNPCPGAGGVPTAVAGVGVGATGRRADDMWAAAAADEIRLGHRGDCGARKQSRSQDDHSACTTETDSISTHHDSISLQTYTAKGRVSVPPGLRSPQPRTSIGVVVLVEEPPTGPDRESPNREARLGEPICRHGHVTSTHA